MANQTDDRQLLREASLVAVPKLLAGIPVENHATLLQYMGFGQEIIEDYVADTAATLGNCP